MCFRSVWGAVAPPCFAVFLLSSGSYSSGTPCHLPILGEEIKCFACRGFRVSLADGLTGSSPTIGEVARSAGGVWLVGIRNSVRAEIFFRRHGILFPLYRNFISARTEIRARPHEVCLVETGHALSLRVACRAGTCGVADGDKACLVSTWVRVPCRDVWRGDGDKACLVSTWVRVPCRDVWRDTGRQGPALSRGLGGHFPVMIFFISFSLLRASTGVRWSMSAFMISSRTWASTGSSSWKMLSW